MKIRTCCVLGIALGATCAADAAFTGLVVECNYVGAGWVENGYAGLTTCRVYADFDDPSDFLISCWGAPGQPLSWTSPSGEFWNSAVADSLVAPIDLTPEVWSNQWDTFVTIGAFINIGNSTGVSPGFAAETNGLATDFSSQNAAWYITPADPCGFALYYPNGMIPIAQITTVATAGGVSGSLGVMWNDSAGNTQTIYQLAKSDVDAGLECHEPRPWGWESIG